VTRKLLLLLAVLAPVWLFANAAYADEDSDACMRCHGNEAELKKSLQDPAAAFQSLLLNAEQFARTVHGEVSCVDCHDGFSEHPHSTEGTTLSCKECHEEAAELHALGVHGQPGQGKTGTNAACTDCHGVHDVFKADVRESHLHPLNVHKTCGACHFDVDPSTATVAQLLKERLSDDAHARGILSAGLVGSATCVTCHGGHDIKKKGDPESRLARERVEQVCANCHLGVVEAYRTSVHFLEPNRNGDGTKQAATCTDCHQPHHIGVHVDDFRLTIVKTCTNCHKEQGESFGQSYHGKVVGLGYGDQVATCDRCHGHHAIRPASDPTSSVHPTNLVGTCGACHANAHEEFVKYEVHADVHDAEANPGLNFVYQAMVLLLVGTFAVMLLHSVLWLLRSIKAGDWKRPPVPKSGKMIRRWRPLYSALHIGMMVSFLALAMTGLPIHYSGEAWAGSMMRFVGGPEVAQFIHRSGALILIGVVLIYLIDLLRRAFFAKEKGLWTGPNTMLPRVQDVKDIIANVRWFVGAGPRPRFDRWTYWEKFDFWAVFWGMAIIGGSGLALWFPVAATRILPAWFLNVSVIIHGHEALLAVGFIFSIHIFNTHLRPEKFPMDLMFATGRMTEEEFKHERPLEYERAVAEGTLENMYARTPRRTTRVRSYILGTIALVIGFSCVAGMLITLLTS
jgi:cytochrome b subunit of formate dehydrogenase/nitrate/TMAO reductase-like tetraheme cytochrome c subunit